MKVDTIRKTEEPEKLVVQTARGDYLDGYIGDTPYRELIQSVSTDDHHVDDVIEVFGWEDLDTEPGEFSVKKYAFLERMFKRGHWGPFEHPSITIAVKGISRSCMAQLTRHRHVTFDVQSQRYVDFSTKEDPVKTPKSLTDEDHFSRETGLVDVEDMENLRNDFEANVEGQMRMYEKFTEKGIPKEDARFLLPIGTVVNLSLTVNARTLLHIEDMRNSGDAQWEIRKLTQKIHDEFEEWMPMTAYLYEKHGPNKIAP